MRSFDLSVELGRSRLNIYMPHPFVLDMPVKLRLKLMTSVSADRVNTKGEFLNYIIDKLYGTLLIVTWIDLQRPDPGSIVNCRVLKASDSMALKIPQRSEFHINLNMMAGNFF